MTKTLEITFGRFVNRIGQPAASAQIIQGDIFRDGVKPGLKFGFWPVPGCTAVNPHEYFLCKIFCGALIAHETIDKIQYSRIIMAHEFFKCKLVALLNSQHLLNIGVRIIGTGFFEKPFHETFF